MMNYPVNITFTIGSLFKLAYLVIGIYVLFYCFLNLKYIYLILKRLNEVLDKNVDTLDTLIKDSSNIVHKVNSLTEKVPGKAMNVVGDLKDSISLIQVISSMLLGLGKKKHNDN